MVSWHWVVFAAAFGFCFGFIIACGVGMLIEWNENRWRAPGGTYSRVGPGLFYERKRR